MSVLDGINAEAIALLVLISLGLIFALYIMVRLSLWLNSTFLLIVHRKRPHESRDAQRVYSGSEKRMGNERAYHRCEGTGYIRRCRYRGSDLHGDHWFPHSRGGATTMRNLVMLCPKCNMKKSAYIPNYLQTHCLRMRRKYGEYDGPGEIMKAGEWLPRRYQNFKKHSKVIDDSQPTF